MRARPRRKSRTAGGGARSESGHTQGSGRRDGSTASRRSRSLRSSERCCEPGRTAGCARRRAGRRDRRARDRPALADRRDGPARRPRRRRRCRPRSQPSSRARPCPPASRRARSTDVATLPPALRRRRRACRRRTRRSSSRSPPATIASARSSCSASGAAFSEADHASHGSLRRRRRWSPAADAQPNECARRPALLDTAGEALAAGAEGARVEPAVVRLAARGAGARAAVLWELGDNGRRPSRSRRSGCRATRSSGSSPPERPPPGDRRVVVAGERSVRRHAAHRRVAGGAAAAPVRRAAARRDARARSRSSRGGRASALRRRPARASGRAWSWSGRARCSRVVGQAIAELSLAHTLETAVARVAELLGTERVAVYLREDGGLRAGGRARRCRPAHRCRRGAARTGARPAARPRRARRRGRVARDPGSRGVRDAARAAGDRGRGRRAARRSWTTRSGCSSPTFRAAACRAPNETALLVALAAQLGVAVQNAACTRRPSGSAPSASVRWRPSVRRRGSCAPSTRSRSPSRRACRCPTTLERRRADGGRAAGRRRCRRPHAGRPA